MLTVLTVPLLYSRARVLTGCRGCGTTGNSSADVREQRIGQLTKAAKNVESAGHDRVHGELIFTRYYPVYAAGVSCTDTAMECRDR